MDANDIRHLSRARESFAPLTPEQLAALRGFAAEHGRTWKAKLGLGWARAAYPGPLQALRNSHGPAWLARFAFPIMPHNKEHERKEARALVHALLRTGAVVSVYDGEDWAIKKSRDRALILDSMGSTDADVLSARNAAGERLGTFCLIYGNGPGELIADHSDNDYCNAIWAQLNGGAA